MCLYCSYVFEHFYEAGKSKKAFKSKIEPLVQKKKKKSAGARQSKLNQPFDILLPEVSKRRQRAAF